MIISGLFTLILLAAAGRVIWLAIEELRYEEWGAVAVLTVVTIFILGIAAAPATALFIPHHQTHEGVAVGYVMDVHEGGVFWDTISVEFKTAGENPETKNFCVEDPDLANQQRQHANTRQLIRLEYTTHLWWSEECVADNDKTIRTVEVLQ